MGTSVRELVTARRRGPRSRPPARHGHDEVHSSAVAPGASRIQHASILLYNILPPPVAPLPPPAGAVRWCIVRFKLCALIDTTFHAPRHVSAESPNMPHPTSSSSRLPSQTPSLAAASASTAQSTSISRLQQISSHMASPQATAFGPQAVPQAPEDPLFGLMAAYRKDTFDKKVDLGIGAYRDDNAKPWVLPVVKKVRHELPTRGALPTNADRPTSSFATTRTSTTSTSPLPVSPSSPAPRRSSCSAPTAPPSRRAGYAQPRSMLEFG